MTGVAKLWLNTEPEADLLDEIWPTHAPAEVIGEGIPVPESYDPEGFRRRHGLGDRRFVLYAGRREGAKNWDALLDGFVAAIRKEDLDLSLVTFGVGEVTCCRRRSYRRPRPLTDRDRRRSLRRPPICWP